MKGSAKAEGQRGGNVCSLCREDGNFCTGKKGKESVCANRQIARVVGIPTQCPDTLANRFTALLLSGKYSSKAEERGQIYDKAEATHIACLTGSDQCILTLVHSATKTYTQILFAPIAA